MVVVGGCLGERSVDRFQAWYFPDRLNGKGQRLAALVSYEREAVCVSVCVVVCVHVCLCLCVHVNIVLILCFFKSLVTQSHACERIHLREEIKCVCACFHCD